MRSTARRPRQVTAEQADGYSISMAETEVAEPSPAHLDLGLRMLARLMIRSYQNNGDSVANVAEKARSLDLTVVPDPSAHVTDDAA